MIPKVHNPKSETFLLPKSPASNMPRTEPTTPNIPTKKVPHLAALSASAPSLPTINISLE